MLSATAHPPERLPEEQRCIGLSRLCAKILADRGLMKMVRPGPATRKRFAQVMIGVGARKRERYADVNLEEIARTLARD
jgi:hypothetical protein